MKIDSAKPAVKCPIFGFKSIILDDSIHHWRLYLISECRLSRFAGGLYYSRRHHSSVGHFCFWQHIFWHYRKFRHSLEKTILASLQIGATQTHILTPGSIDSFAADPLDQLTPRLISELDATFSELTI